jgi:hypothetical protein
MSAARLAANRANAQKSTGPRTAAGKLRAVQNARKSTGPTTAAGKKRSAQNARRHGLNVPACLDPAVAGRIAHLTCAIASCAIASCAIAAANDDPQVIALAHRVAAAQVDLMRARSSSCSARNRSKISAAWRRSSATSDAPAPSEPSQSAPSMPPGLWPWRKRGRPSWRNEPNPT